tara:strand:- start:1428 stop:2576 length:1149 start_codon:yes stop_codon:yes gene_type:complete
VRFGSYVAQIEGGDSNVFRALIILIFGLPLMFLAAELGVRQTHWRYLVVPQAPAFPPGVFDEDPLLDFDLAPGKSQQALTYRGPGHDISSNRWGCFDFDRGTGDDYILVIGGDAAWGQVPLTHHWATVLENELGSRVLKCGVPGTGTAYHVQKAKRVIDDVGKPPALVVLMYEPNDFSDDFVGQQYLMEGQKRRFIFRWLDLESGYVDRHTSDSLKAERQKSFQKKDAMGLAMSMLEQSVLFATGQYFFERFKPAEDKSNNRVYQLDETDFFQGHEQHGWLNNEMDAHLENLQSLQTLASWNNSQLLVVTDNFSFPGRGQAAKEFFEAQGVHVFDVGRRVRAKAAQRDKNAYLTYYRLWNKRGNQFAGFEITDYIRKNGLQK